VLVAFVVLAVISIAGGRDMVRSTFGGAMMVGAPSGLQAVVLLCTLAIFINLALFFFNLFPIPPLDGSRIIRNVLPYSAVQAYDRVPFWVSYMLMLLVGGYVLRLLMTPALALVAFGLFNI